MRCPNCSAVNLEGAVYCDDCGYDLRSAAPAPTTYGEGLTAAAYQGGEGQATEAPQGGARIVQCPVCKSDHPEHAAFCEDCGSSLAAVPTPPGATRAGIAPPASPSIHGPRLILAASGKEFPLIKERMVIGRASPCDGIYPDLDLTGDDPESYLSRRHGMITQAGGQYLFEDMGSANGSFINRTKAQKGLPQALKDNDRLILGKTELVFRI
ncbi:MAG: FHA domain-containing protein [Candidatus Eremiobacteraeota bacterium]|nr:FHA domain-containing protein [Candidatus Eremiobacteraeota bacterium]